MRTPRTLHELYAQFPDEDACWRALRQMRWPHGFVCPRCGGRGSHRLRTRRLDQCRSCRHQVSPTAGTIFHKTRVPLRTWFLAIFFVARHKKGISALQLQRDTGLGSYQTAWTMLHKIRSSLAHRPEFRLTGSVEGDEAYVGGATSGGKPGRGAPNKALVAGAVERREHSAGSVRLAVVESASQKELGPFVRGVINAHEATVLTDGWSGYGDLTAHGAEHCAVVQGSAARAGEILPWIHTRCSRTSRPGCAARSTASAPSIWGATSRSSLTASTAAAARPSSSSSLCAAPSAESRSLTPDSRLRYLDRHILNLS